MSEETLEKNSTHKPIKGHGGARDGAGRKSGKMSEENRAKLEVLEKMRKRIMRSSEKLLNSQMNLAEYRIELLTCPKPHCFPLHRERVYDLLGVC